MSASDVEAGKAYVKITADDKVALAAVDRFSKRFRAMGAAVSSVGTRIAAVAAAGFGALGAAAYAYTDAAGKAVDASDRLGVSVDAFTGLSYAAEQGGAGAEELESGMRKMQKTIADARGGSKTATEALAALGLTLDDLDGKTPDEQFKLLANGVAGITDPAQKTAAVMNVLGKSGTALIPMLNGGAAGMERLIARAVELGAVMSDKDARAADDFGDQLGDLRTAIRGAVNVVGSALVPILSAVVDSLTNCVVYVRKFINDNRDAIRVVVAIVSSLGVAAGTLLAFGAALKAVGVGLGLVAPLLLAFKVGAAAIAAAVAFLLSPIGLVVVAIAGLATAFFTCTETGGAAIDWLVARFNGLATDAVSAWQGIGAALASGDLGLAAQIGWSFVTMTAQKAWHFVVGIWKGFSLWIRTLFSDAWYGAIIVVADVLATLESWWVETVSFFGDTWDLFTNSFMQAWNTATGWIQKQWTKVMGLISDDVNVEAELKRIDDQTNAANQQSQQATEASNAARMRRKDDRLAGIESDRALVAPQAAAESEAANAERQRVYDSEIAAGQADLAKTQAEYNALIQKAHDQRTAKDAASLEAKKPLDVVVPEAVNKTASQMKQSESVAGSFNAAAGIGFAKSGGAIDRIATATEETRDAVIENTRAVRDSAAVFA